MLRGHVPSKSSMFIHKLDNRFVMAVIPIPMKEKIKSCWLMCRNDLHARFATPPSTFIPLDMLDRFEKVINVGFRVLVLLFHFGISWIRINIHNVNILIHSIFISLRSVVCTWIQNQQRYIKRSVQLTPPEEFLRRFCLFFPFLATVIDGPSKSSPLLEGGAMEGGILDVVGVIGRDPAFNLSWLSRLTCVSRSGRVTGTRS